MKRTVATLAVIAGLSACASYEPARENTLEQLASGGCGDEGKQTLLTAYVNKAYDNTVVLWDGSDSGTTVAANFPRPGFGQRLRGVFGETKNQKVAEQLSQLAQQRVPVTFQLVCQGEVAPMIRSASYTDPQGQRVAIAY